MTSIKLGWSKCGCLGCKYQQFWYFFEDRIPTWESLCNMNCNMCTSISTFNETWFVPKVTTVEECHRCNDACDFKILCMYSVYIYIYICVDTHTCTHSKHYILKICIHVMDVMFNYIHTECWPGWPLLLNWWAIKQPQNKTKLNDLGISLEASKFETSKTTCNFRILECTTDTSQQNSCTITVQDTRGTDAETVHICFFAAQLNDITL